MSTIRKIEVKNYRLLKKFELDLENELSLIIGKNNCGKTSLLTVLDKFLNFNKFTSNDFNLDYKKEIFSFLTISMPSEDEYKLKIKGILLRLYIEYTETDNLSNLSDLMLDLDDSKNIIILNFEYILTYDNLLKMKTDFDEFILVGVDNEKKFNYFFQNEYSGYFTTIRKSIELEGEEVKSFIDLDKEKVSLKEIINYKFISAKREVSNRDIDKTLSSQTSKIYKSSESTPEQLQAINDFKQELFTTDQTLNDNYQTIFDGIIQKVKKFGGMKQNESTIEIHSTLQHRELLEGNTTVMYSHGDHSLPEHYNGLGYMNLISMIFEIELLLTEFKKSENEKPADINLLFIEEPEAHTHPQMQYIFIKNIKSLLEDGIKRSDGIERKLQYLISTHSSHIVSESNFDVIKYLKKNVDKNSVISKNLKDLEKEYEEDGEEKNFRFLKQYLTLNRAELFFADKAILIEGDTERILLPSMMKKIDVESGEESEKLLSQNISIVEVGAHSQTFEKFIDFIGIKTLIITDIDGYYEKTLFEVDGVTPQQHANDSIKKETIPCRSNDVDIQHTSNYSLLFFHDKKDDNTIDYFKNLTLNEKKLLKNPNRKWIQDDTGNLLLVFQTNEKDIFGEEYHARSFEDAFFHINKRFIKNDFNEFDSLVNKWFMKFKKDEIDCYDFANKAVTKKPPLAIEILMNSSRKQKSVFDCTTWNIPLYIKEGLEWLRDN